MRIRGWGRIQGLREALRRRRETSTIILAYHRVIDRARDPLLVCVSPKNFADHLEIIRKRSRPLPLQKLTRKILQGERCRRSVVLTFDDGYADNLHEAKPILTRFQVPATVFVTAGLLMRPQEFWWLTLERIFLVAGRLPEHLTVNVGHVQHTYELGAAAQYGQQDSEAHRGWDILLKQVPTVRHHIYRDLFFALCPLSAQEQQQILRELLEWAAPETGAEERDQILTPDEVNALTKGGLVEVGSHCMTHPVLSSLSEQEQREEIFQSKHCLETYLEHPVKSFAYPYGRREDYTPATVQLVREAGFTCACSNFEGGIGETPNRFQLPRFLVRNWSKEEFARRFEAWMQF